jgi:hypothetical protein
MKAPSYFEFKSTNFIPKRICVKCKQRKPLEGSSGGLKFLCAGCKPKAPRGTQSNEL